MGIHSTCSVPKDRALLICDSRLESTKLVTLQGESIWGVSENNLGAMPQFYFFQRVSLIISIAELHLHRPSHTEKVYKKEKKNPI